MRQTSIPGTETKTPAAVRAAGDAYVHEAARGAKQQQKILSAKETLIAVMIKEKCDSFRDDDANPPVIISLTERHGIKVTKLKTDEEDGEDDSEAEA